MKFSIPIPQGFEVRLTGPNLTLIGPNGTKEWSGDRFFNMNLTNDNFRGNNIVLIPHLARWVTVTWDSGNKMDQDAINQCAFMDCKVIENLLKEVT